MLRLATEQGGLGLADYATIVAGVLAALGLFDYGRSLFRRTIGRRREIARRFARLGTGAQLSFFESVLGEPPALRRSFEIEEQDWGATRDDDTETPLVTRSYVQSYFIDPLYYVQTVSDADDSVVGFSITTRSRRFHPTITVPRPPSRQERIVHRLTLGRRRPSALARVQLGRTKFAQAGADDSGAPRIHSWMGVRAASYSEVRYFGNPGFYQDVVFTTSSASPVGGYVGPIEDVAWKDDPWPPIDEAELGAEDEGDLGADDLEDEDDCADDSDVAWLETAPDWIRNLHEDGVITTITLIGMAFPIEEWPSFGPHGDEVRTIP